jgi:hypothetical protein
MTLDLIVCQCHGDAYGDCFGTRRVSLEEARGNGISLSFNLCSIRPEYGRMLLANRVEALKVSASPFAESSISPRLVTGDRMHEFAKLTPSMPGPTGLHS